MQRPGCPGDQHGCQQHTLYTAHGALASAYPSLALGFGGGLSGQVLTITVKAGQQVQAGDTLALLDDSDLQRELADAQLALERAVIDRERADLAWQRDVADAEQAVADAQRALATARLQYSSTSVEEALTTLSKAQQAEADAKDEYTKSLDRPWDPPELRDRYYDEWQRAMRERELAEMRLADARDNRSANSLELDARAADVEQAERKLAALNEGLAPSYERAVEDARQRLAKAEEALAHARLAAPWAAIVLSLNVAPSATVGAGTSVLSLLNVEDGLRFVTHNLSEQHVTGLQPGQRAIVTLRAFASQPLEGRVEAVVPQAGESTSADARFTVYVRLAPTSLNLLPGLTGRVEIFTQ